MGHLINPISNRLTINSFWNSNWVLSNLFNYVNVFKQDYLLFQFLNWFSKKSKFGEFNVIVSHYKVFRLYKKVYINFYYYDVGLEERKYNFQVTSLLTLLQKKKKAQLKQQRKFDLISPVVNSNIYSIENKNNIGLSKYYKTKTRDIYIYLIRILISNLYWYMLNNSLNYYLSKLSKHNNQYFFNVYSLDFLNITTDIISTYISLKLQQKYSLNWILRPILKDLTNKIKSKVFLGYKIVCSGRFSRKQLATYMWMKQGSVKLNKFSNLIKYSQTAVKTKYGICGIKVWLNYGSNDSSLFKRNLSLIYPHYVPFKYIIDPLNKSLILSLNYWYFIYLKISFFKSRTYNFYKLFSKMKIQIIIHYVFKKIFKDLLLKEYQIKYLTANTLAITVKDKPISYFLMKKN